MNHASSGGRIHFPIEGQSVWVSVFRVFALGMTGAVVAGVSVFQVLDDGGSGKNVLWPWLIAVVLIAEFVFLRCVFVPIIANYGRYRIYEHKVDFSPLSIFGAGGGRVKSEPCSRFSGIAVSPASSGSPVVVYLLHPARGMSVPVRRFRTAEEARHFAQELAAALHLTVIPWPSGGLFRMK